MLQGGEYVAKLIESLPSLELIELGDTDQVLSSIDSILEMTKKSNLKVLDISRVIPKTEYEILNTSWMAKNVGLFLEVIIILSFHQKILTYLTNQIFYKFLQQAKYLMIFLKIIQ